MFPRCFHCSGSRAGVGLSLLFLLAMIVSMGGAPRSPFTPQQTRALFLYHFATFTTFPKQAFEKEGSPLVIGILGKDDFEGATVIIEDEPIRERKVVVRMYKRGEVLEGCHLLFICSSEHSRMGEVLQELKGKAVVTVAELPGFLEQGGMINLVMNMETKKLEFEVNLNAVRERDLKMSSQFLRLARRLLQDGK